MRNFFIALFLTTCLVNGNCQIADLSNSESQALKMRAVQKIKDLQKKLEIIASKKFSYDQKLVYSDGVKELFINRGEAVSPCKRRQFCGPVIMQVSSSVNKKVYRRKLSDYLFKLANLPYSNVEITSANTFNVSEIYASGVDADGDSLFTAHVDFQQMFRAFGSNGEYQAQPDITSKKVEILFKKKSSPIDVSYNGRWIVYLGNISINHTEPFR